MKIAVITARAGSKRIPNKNIRNFLGKPIISYPIESAVKSNLFDEIIVSTDSALIAEISISLGAKVPFIRSSKNSDDLATTADVMLEVYEQFLARRVSVSSFCCIYPTAVFTTPELLITSYNKFIMGDFDIMMPVVRFDFPVQRGLLVNDNEMRPFFPDMYMKRSQDLEPVFHDTGQFYWINPVSLKQTKSLLGSKSGCVIVEPMHFQDIDQESDWHIAEMKYILFQKNESLK